MRAGVVDTVLRRDGDDDAAVFERARQLGFAGVEVVLRRGDLESGRLEEPSAGESRDRGRSPVARAGLPQRGRRHRRRRPERRAAGCRRRASLDCVGARAGCRRRARAVLPPGRAPRRGGRRPMCGRFRGAVPDGGRRGRDALLRGDAPGRRRYLRSPSASPRRPSGATSTWRTRWSAGSTPQRRRDDSATSCVACISRTRAHGAVTAGRGSARSTTRSVPGRSRRRATAAGSFSRRRRRRPSSSRGT